MINLVATATIIYVANAMPADSCLSRKLNNNFPEKKDPHMGNLQNNNILLQNIPSCALDHQEQEKL